MGLKLETVQEPLKKLLSLLGTALNVTAPLRTLLLLAALNLALPSCVKKKSSLPEAVDTFVINLPREIHSVDPLLLRGTAKRYILFNLHRGLFYYGKNNQIQSYGAKACKWTSPVTFDCELADVKWSDGSNITSNNYVYSFQQITNLKEESLGDITKISSLKSLSPNKLRFKFASPVKNAKHILTSIALTPRNKNTVFKDSNSQLFSGPYELSALNESEILLSPNKYFEGGERPNVKGVFVDDPSAALNMYEAGKLNFLRYLESSNISSYNDVLFAPFAKLDGLFLNKEKLSLNARKALMHSLNFKDLQKLYSSPSTPGCLAVPRSFFKKSLNCLEFNLEQAQSFYKKSELKGMVLKIHIPNADADEHKKLALWARSQWLQNLDLKVEIQMLEKKVFYDSASKGKFSIYRKSQPLNNLSCESAVESLSKEREFEGISTQTCTQFFESALNNSFWIPLGMPSYTHLPSKKFSGYYINLLGQFGLEALKKVNNN